MTAPPETERLFQDIKSQALPGVWSQGVKLARASGITLESSTPSELVLRVPVAGRAVAPTVLLYPEEAEWTCDCSGKNDPCEHAVAAAIALQQGLATPAATQDVVRLKYRLTVERKQLRVRRWFSSAAGDNELSASLASLVARGTCPFSPSQDDIQVDRLLSAVPRGDFNLGQMQRLLGALASLDVELDGKPVRVSKEPLKPVARVFDEGDSIVLRIEPSPEVTEVLAPGLGLAGQVLRPIGAPEIGGLRMERLPLERRLRSHETAELVGRILPDLEKSIEVHVETNKLAQRSRSRSLAPWIDFDLGDHGHTLSVLPTLVYGKPPVARLDADRLVLLGQVVPERDRSLEQQLATRLRDRLNLALGRRVHFDGEQAAAFAQRLRAFSSDSDAETPLGELPELLPRVDLDPARFNVEFELAGVDGRSASAVSADAVLRAWRDGVELVPLLGGGFAALPRDWLARFGEQLSTLLGARDARGALPTFAIPALATLAEQLDQPPPPEMQRLEPLFRGFSALPDAKLPSDLVAELRPYQLDAVRWLTFLRDAELGAVLADDMGLGKTLQTLCVLEGRSLVVCPRSVLFNWEREIARFRPALSSSVYHGPERKLNPEAKVTLTSYAVLRLDIEALSTVDWNVCVLDEAQAIKNPTSQTALAAYDLNAKFRLALSGTPVENRLEELWSIFRFTHPGLLGTRKSFEERFERPMASGDADATRRLRELTKPFLLRRLKREVAQDLPPRTDALLPIELDEVERTVYDAILVATKSEVVRELERGGSVMQALEALLRLRQAACHSGLVPGQHADRSSKTEALLDALADLTADGHKALVFSQWTSLLDRIEPHLTKAGIAFTRLDGSTRDRGQVVEDFQDPDGPPVLLASLKAGGTGLNLTAADHVFIMDPWYNPAAEDQAADRAHRIGQDKPVMVYRLVAKGTVEEGILELQEQKRRLAESALSGRGSASAITREDLLRLLER